jgi:hypothetical protein
MKTEPCSVLMWGSVLFVLNFGLYLYYGARFRRRVKNLLSLNKYESPSVDEVCKRLAVVSNESNPLFFDVEKLANIEFRGKRISVVYGPVSYPSVVRKSGSMRGSNRSLFALVASDEIGWIKANADVFSPAFAGVNDSVFWIDLGRMIAELSHRNERGGGGDEN